MGQVLRCLRSLMNLENGMDAVLGVTEGSSGGLRQLGRCIDTKHESVHAKTVQAQALTLLSAAALYSAEGHDQVLDSLDALKKTRRRMHRFGWLVEACNHDPVDEDQDEKGDDDDFDLSRATTGIRRRKPDGGGGGGGGGGVDPDRALHRVKGVEMVSCCLILINAIIGFPESLVARVRLRSEFIRLSLLDVLQQLHREKHVDVVRQVSRQLVRVRVREP